MLLNATRNDSNGPTTTIRTTETNVEVRDGQMVVTGGLMSDRVTESTRGVPILEDIPLLGEYFKRRDKDYRKTNLIIFITPRVIRDQFDARETTIDARDTLQDILNDQQFGPDRQDILRNPHIDKVSEQYNGEIPVPSTMTPPVSVSHDQVLGMKPYKSRKQNGRTASNKGIKVIKPTFSQTITKGADKDGPMKMDMTEGTSTTSETENSVKKQVF